MKLTAIVARSKALQILLQKQFKPHNMWMDISSGFFSADTYHGVFFENNNNMSTLLTNLPLY